MQKRSKSEHMLSTNATKNTRTMTEGCRFQIEGYSGVDRSVGRIEKSMRQAVISDADPLQISMTWHSLELTRRGLFSSFLELAVKVNEERITI